MWGSAHAKTNLWCPPGGLRLEPTNRMKKRGMGRSCRYRMEVPSSSLSPLNPHPSITCQAWTMPSAQAVSTTREFMVNVSNPLFFPSWFWLSEQYFTIQEQGFVLQGPCLSQERQSREADFLWAGSLQQYVKRRKGVYPFTLAKICFD